MAVCRLTSQYWSTTREAHPRFTIILADIENRLYCSPANLLASCETVASIAHMLGLPHDQFSVYQSNPLPSQPLATFCGGQPCNLRGIRSSSKTKMRDQTYSLRSLLDSIKIDTKKPKASYLRRAVDAIRNATSLAAAQEFSHQASQPEASAHIFVLTAHPFGLNRFVPDDRFQVHVVCSGVIPWSLSPGHMTNGWCLLNKDFLSPGLTQHANSRFQAELRSLLRAARSGFLPAHLKNVRIFVNSGPHSMIEGLLGSTSFPLLAPGEIRTVLIKVRLLNREQAPASLSAFPRDFRTASGHVDVERELDAALHHDFLPVLTVQLEYEHSALPSDTVCKVSREAYLRSEVSRSLSYAQHHCRSWQQSTPEEHREREKSHHTVQARLAFHLATSQKQGKGIQSIMTQFPGQKSNSAGPLPGYIKEIVDELKHQSQILDRIESHGPLVTSTSPEAFRFSLRQSPMINSNTSQSTLSRLDLETAFPKPPSPLRLRKKPSSDNDDQARQIWTALRLRKNVNKHGLDHRKPLIEASTETLRDMKRRAENNNRSLGEDTLRSLRIEKMQENVAPAPWL